MSQSLQRVGKALRFSSARRKSRAQVASARRARCGPSTRLHRGGEFARRHAPEGFGRKAQDAEPEAHRASQGNGARVTRAAASLKGRLSSDAEGRGEQRGGDAHIAGRAALDGQPRDLLVADRLACPAQARADDAR